MLGIAIARMVPGVAYLPLCVFRVSDLQVVGGQAAMTLGSWVRCKVPLPSGDRLETGLGDVHSGCMENRGVVMW